MTSRFSHPTPELPVEDVELAQEHYRKVLGFKIEWLYPGNDIGAVSRDDASIFFRKRSRPFEPAINWVFAQDIDAMYTELRSSGAKIVEPLERSRGACVNSQWKTSMATASTSTVIERRRAEARTAPSNSAQRS